jgi:hypothetical protein
MGVRADSESRQSSSVGVGLAVSVLSDRAPDVVFFFFFRNKLLGQRFSLEPPSSMLDSGKNKVYLFPHNNLKAGSQPDR